MEDHETDYNPYNNRCSVRCGRKMNSLAMILWVGGLGMTGVMGLCAGDRQVSASGLQVKPAAPAAGKPAPLPYRLRLIKKLSQETLAETIQGLPNFDDTLWVKGDLFPGRIVPPESAGSFFGENSYKYLSVFIPRLNRVRKIVEEAGKKPQTAVPLLTKLFSTSVAGYEAARTAHLKEEAKRDPTKPVAIENPDEYYRCRIAAPATAYLLAELRAYDALPVLSRAYQAKGKLPMSRAFLFYAMHLLAVDHPQDRLAPAVRKALEQYCKVAKCLPPAKNIEVASWRADYDEGDFRIVLGKEDLGLDRQPKVKLRHYPAELDNLDSWEGRPKQNSPVNLPELFGKLEAFVKLAYPE